MEKHYQKPKTDVVLLTTTKIMQLATGSGSLPPGSIGNAPKRRGRVF
ncbi:MAG: hypothetical protein II825_04625 [Paludibacteraceae bacterium]|nr:hypothetical protein [Paludibacteraceae bacterium]